VRSGAGAFRRASVRLLIGGDASVAGRRLQYAAQYEAYGKACVERDAAERLAEVAR